MSEPAEPNETPVEVVELPRALDDAARDLLVAVFADDPSWGRFVPWRPLRMRVLRWYYTRAIRRARSHGAVDAIVRDGAVEAVAVWDAPRSRTRVADRLLGLLGRRGRRPATAGEREPAWHLEAVVVSDGLRGSGSGSRMLQHGLARVDAVGTPARLEATTPASQRLYERFGFTPAHVWSGERPVEVVMRRPAAR